MDFALESMRNSKNGSTVAALMHVSVAFRLRINTAFSPVKLYEIDVPQEEQTTKFDSPEPLVSFVWSAIRWYCQDFFLQRHDKQAAPQCASKEVVLFTKGEPAHVVEIKGTVWRHSRVLGSMITKRAAQLRASWNKSTDITVDDICERLIYALVDQGTGPQVSDSPPRSVNVHQTALPSGSLQEPLDSTKFEVLMVLKLSETDPASQWYTKKWHLVHKLQERRAPSPAPSMPSVLQLASRLSLRLAKQSRRLLIHRHAELNTSGSMRKPHCLD